jgi:hypothetical protein
VVQGLNISEHSDNQDGHARPPATAAIKPGVEDMDSPPATRDEILLLSKRAELHLKPEHFEELVEAYALVEKMLPTVRCVFDIKGEPAHVFVAKMFEQGTN